jgi:hypothetical protein
MNNKPNINGEEKMKKQGYLSFQEFVKEYTNKELYEWYHRANMQQHGCFTKIGKEVVAGVVKDIKMEIKRRTQLSVEDALCAGYLN